MKATAATAALVLSFTASALAQPSSRCSRETLNVRGTGVTAAYCVTSDPKPAPGHELSVPISEVFSSGKGSFTRTATLSFMAGESPSRVIEDVPLEKLGLEGTLHLTLTYRAGQVTIESALLTPGAITIK